MPETKTKLEVKKLDLSLTTHLGILSGRSYKTDRTNIPFNSYPPDLKELIPTVFKLISGDDFTPEEVNTFTVVADDNGGFKYIITPCIVSNLEEDCLILLWGEREIPLYIKDEMILPDSEYLEDLKKFEFKFEKEEYGGYPSIVLKASLTDQATRYIVSFPVRLKKTEDFFTRDKNKTAPFSEETFNIAVETDDIDNLCEHIRDINDLGGGGLKGYLISAGYCALGKYDLIDYIQYENQSYGKGYMIQAVAKEFSDNEEKKQGFFEAMTKIKDPKTGVQEKKTVQIALGEKFIISANSTMKKIFEAKPVISEEEPAILYANEHGMYGENPTLKCTINCEKFESSENSFAMDDW